MYVCLLVSRKTLWKSYLYSNRCLPHSGFAYFHWPILTNFQGEKFEQKVFFLPAWKIKNSSEIFCVKYYYKTCTVYTIRFKLLSLLVLWIHIRKVGDLKQECKSFVNGASQFIYLPQEAPSWTLWTIRKEKSWALRPWISQLMQMVALVPFF